MIKNALISRLQRFPGVSPHTVEEVEISYDLLNFPSETTYYAIILAFRAGVEHVKHYLF